MRTKSSAASSIVSFFSKCFIIVTSVLIRTTCAVRGHICLSALSPRAGSWVGFGPLRPDGNEAPPACRLGAMKWLIGAAVAFSICVTAYADSAVISLANLVSAVRHGDADEVMARSDVPRVRHSLIVRAEHHDRRSAP